MSVKSGSRGGLENEAQTLEESDDSEDPDKLIEVLHPDETPQETSSDEHIVYQNGRATLSSYNEENGPRVASSRNMEIDAEGAHRIANLFDEDESGEFYVSEKYAQSRDLDSEVLEDLDNQLPQNVTLKYGD